MRILLAMLAITLVVGMADAQDVGGAGGGGGGRGGGKGHGGQAQNGDPKKTEQQKKQIDDAYKSAIGRIPDSKTKYDPWKAAR